MLMLPVEQLLATSHQQRRAGFRTQSQTKEQNPTQKFHPTASTGKGIFSVTMTFSIRDKNFLWTCQSSTDCWSLVEQISLLSAGPKAEKLSFSLYSSSNQNIKSRGSSPYSSSAQRGRQLELGQIPALTKQSRDPTYTPSFLLLIILKPERRDGLL